MNDDILHDITENREYAWLVHTFYPHPLLGTRRGWLYNQRVESGVPLVSYILVNWNTEDLLPRALDSIEAQIHGLSEVFVVDNGSPGFDPELLAGRRNVTLISNPTNRGFAAANNQALSACNGDFIVLLNCDACLAPGFIRAALAPFSANPRIGTVVPKVLRDDDSGVIDSAGHVMYSDRTPAHRGQGEQDQGQYDAAGFVFGGTAAAAVYRREMLEQVSEGGSLAAGGQVFCEQFFAYYEDVDLDWRANLAGWRAYYEPEAVAFHRGHGSGGRRSYRIRLIAEKNRYLMLARNDTVAAQWRDWRPLLVYETWHFIKTLLQPWLWPAYLVLLWCLPGAWAYRLAQGRQRVIPAGDIADRFHQRGVVPPIKPEPPRPTGGILEQPTADAPSSLVNEPERDAASVFPPVSVILVNYNGLDMTKRCVDALKRQSYKPLEVIVVDNGSVVDEADLLAVGRSGVKTLHLTRNQGFSGGVNWGLAVANGDYIVLLNNDAIPDDDCIRNLVYAARRTGAPAVSGRLVDITSEQEVKAALAMARSEAEPGERYIGGATPVIEAAVRESRLNHGISLHGFGVHDAYGEVNECFYPSGGLCILTREAVEALGPELFPHWYFAYHEDVYLGLRLRARGGWVAKEPRAVVAHIAGSTARRLGRPKLRYLMERNRCLNRFGFYPGWLLGRMWPIFGLQQCLYMLYLLVLRPADFVGWLAARLWALTHLREINAWRAKCRCEAVADDMTWLSELSGKVRGQGGALNSLSLWWCRKMAIPHREMRDS